MLYSCMVGFAVYYVVLFVIGVLVSAMAIEGDLITLAVIGFIGAYCVRNYSRFIHRLAMGVGIAATIVLLVIWVILPMLAGSTDKWLVIVSVIAGLVMYLATRRPIFRHYTVHPDGTPAAPPFGREWCRWLFIILA